MSFSSKWALDGIFLIIHVKVMPWSISVDFFSCPNIVTFASLMISEPNFENHDQALIKWCLWLQNKMLTKKFDFWLPNDHFAPAVDCEAIRVFDCATWPCEPWNLTCRYLTMCMSIGDLIEPLENFSFLVRTKTLVWLASGGWLIV